MSALSRSRPVPAAPRLLAGVGAAVLLGASAVAAQETASVAGTVTDVSSGRPVSEARVFVVGTGMEAFAGEGGRYLLEGLPAGEVEVSVERLGYAPAAATVQLMAGQTAALDFALDVSAVALDELVVTATGLQRRRELGNAAVAIQVDDELVRAAPVTLTNLLQGRAAGVQVLQSSGTVGSGSAVKIRGSGSISLSNTPLIYIDGSRISNSVNSGPAVGGQSTSRLNDLNLEDIESVEIVKGPSAATLYGAEAAAGVIRITTKRGRSGTAEWTYRSEWGARWDTTEWPATVWNPRSLFGEVYDVSRLFRAGEIPAGVHFAAIPDTLYSINLLGEGVGGDVVYGTPWRTGIEKTYGASLRGGGQNVTYFLSGELTDQDGTLATNENVQRNLRANLDLVPSERVTLGVSAGYANSRVFMPENDNSGFGFIGVGMLGYPWQAPVRRTDITIGGEWETCPLAWEAHRALADAGFATSLDSLTEARCVDNPFFGERTFEDIETLVSSQQVERVTTSVTLDYNPFGFLSTRGTAGYDQFSDQTGFLVPVDPDLPFNDASRGARSIGHGINRLFTLEGNVNASFSVTPELRSTTSVGAQFFRQKSESTGASGTTLPPGATTASSAVRTQGFESVGETRTLGLYIQEQIEYRDRLFITPALRFDDSSAFGEHLGREAYPRFMASYVLSEEAWFDRIVPGGFVESLRARVAWGQSGKQPASFAALKLLGPRRVTLRRENVAGLSLSGPGNPELRAERGEELELGFEADLLDGRVGVDFTWFSQTTKDAIVARALAPSTGYTVPVFTNIGEIQNGGFELGLSALVINSGSLRWDWQVNASRITGEITDLDEHIIYGLGGNSQRHEEGFPFGSYFSKTYSVDSSGGVAASDTAVYVGHPTPELEGSLSTSVELFGWVTLYADLGFAAGHQQFNSTEQFRCGFLGGGTYGGVCPELFEVDADGELAAGARIKAQAADDDEYAPWIEDADFARLRSVSARVALPGSWLGMVGASRGSFSVTAENLFLLTSYSGLDPEINFAGGSQSTRAEFFTLPPPKRVTGRFSISF